MPRNTLSKLKAVSLELSTEYSDVRFNIPLRDYSTFKVGGPAWALIEPKTAQQLVSIYDFARKRDIPVGIVGAGSSIIPDDRGFLGLIICTRKVEPDPEIISSSRIKVSCGMRLPRLASLCQIWGLSGLEWSIGIPGTLGGAVWMNAGAWGGDTSKILEEVYFWDGYQVVTVTPKEIEWAYRYSTFQSHPEWLILSARLRLKESSPQLVAEATKKVRRKIRETQPRSHPNVGTVFKANREALPALAAGLQVGSVICPEENPGWLLNLGQGTASDVYRLVRLVLLRHLVRGLPLPKIEPVFLPYSPQEEESPSLRLNYPSLPIQVIAGIAKHWRFLFNGNLTTWKPSVIKNPKR
jgi:UDP-N-acetylmuramate dehydrogenase